MFPCRYPALVFIAVIALGGSCSALAADQDGPAGTKLSSVEKQVVELAMGLDYDEATATEFAKLVTSWKAEDGTPLVEQWGEKLTQARRDRKAGKLSEDQLAEAESSIIGELGRTVAKELTYKRRTGAFTLDVLVKRKTAQSVAYAQVVSVVGTAVGFAVEPIGVTYPIRGEQPTLSGHYACLARLTDGRSVEVDPAYDPVVSEPFDLSVAYKKDDGFLVVADEANPLKLHRRIRPLDPDGFRAAAYLGRAQAKYDLWHYKEVPGLVNKAVELDAASAVAYRVRGVVEVNLGQYDAAIADAEKALGLDAELAEAVNALASAYDMRGDVERALEPYARSIEMNPEYVAPRINRCRALLSLGRKEEARQELEKALEVAPNDPTALEWAGMCYQDLGELEQALEQYTAALDADADNATLHVDRACTLALLGKRDEAMAGCAKAIQIEPESAIIRVGVGFVLITLGAYDEAIGHLSRAIQIDPEIPAPYYWRACALQQQGDSVLKRARVLRDLNKTLEVDPTFVGAYVARGNVYLARGKLDKALHDLNLAIKLAPRYDWAYGCRAAVYEQQGEIGAAIADLDKAIECNAGYAWAYWKRGALRAKSGEDERAIQDLRKAVELDPKLAESAQQVADEHALDVDLETSPSGTDGDEDEGPDGTDEGK